MSGDTVQLYSGTVARRGGRAKKAKKTTRAKRAPRAAPRPPPRAPVYAPFQLPQGSLEFTPIRVAPPQYQQLTNPPLNVVRPSQAGDTVPRPVVINNNYDHNRHREVYEVDDRAGTLRIPTNPSDIEPRLIQKQAIRPPVPPPSPFQLPPAMANDVPLQRNQPQNFMNRGSSARILIDQPLYDPQRPGGWVAPPSPAPSVQSIEELGAYEKELARDRPYDPEAIRQRGLGLGVDLGALRPSAPASPEVSRKDLYSMLASHAAGVPKKELGGRVIPFGRPHW